MSKLGYCKLLAYSNVTRLLKVHAMMMIIIIIIIIIIIKIIIIIIIIKEGLVVDGRTILEWTLKR